MKVMVLGATGLTGGMVVEKLLEQPEISTVIAPVRRSMVVENPKLEQRSWILMRWRLSLTLSRWMS